MLSAGADGERVKVVGEDRPGGPGRHPLLSLQARSAQPVAALEVADSALGAGAVSAQAALRSSGARLLAASDEHSLW